MINERFSSFYPVEGRPCRQEQSCTLRAGEFHQNNICLREVLFLKQQIPIAWMFYGFNEKFSSFKICISIIVKSCNGLPAVFRSVIQTPLLSPESHWMLHKGSKLAAKQINKTIPSLWHEPGFVQRPRWDPEPLSGAEPLLRSAWGGNAAQVL